jgi:hypothetical protein
MNAVSLSMPPPSNSSKKDPQIRPASSRKRKETTRAVENADPLLPKNKKLKTAGNRMPPHQDTDTETHLSQSTRKSPIDFEEGSDDVDEVDDVTPSLNILGNILDELANGGANSEDEEESVIDVDELFAVSKNAKAKESADAELSRLVTVSFYYQLKQITDRLSKDWNAPIYAFFKPMPVIEYVDNCHAHVFECGALHCKGRGRFG